MMKSSLRLTTLSLLMFASIGASAAPAANPLQISGVFQEQAGPSARCTSLFGGSLAGHGSSALVGQVAFVANDCITPSGPLYNFSHGHFIVITTTGEQILADYSGQMVPTGVGAQYEFSGGTFQITGGTGRYAKASGGGTLSGGEDLATGSGRLQLAGQILLKKN
jgi:hypothetical protein